MLYVFGNSKYYNRLSSVTMGDSFPSPIWVTTTLPNSTQNADYDSGNIYTVLLTDVNVISDVVQVGGIELSSIGLTLTNYIGYCKITGNTLYVGSFDIILRSTNKGIVTDQTLTINVLNITPYWVTTTLPNPTQNNSYNSGSIIVTNGENFTDVGYTTLSSLGLTLTGYSGYCTIVGTPTTYGNYTITLEASIDNIVSDQNFSLTIDYPYPVWVSTSVPNLLQNSLYNSGNINVTYGSSFVDVYSNLPSLNLTLNSYNGYCTIVGTPTTYGNFGVTVNATNSGPHYTTRYFALNIAPATPIWTTTNISNLTQNNLYDSGNIYATYANYFSQYSGTSLLVSLGLTLNSYAGYCKIVGTPSTYGSYSITLKAQNGTATANQTFSLIIDQDIPAPSCYLKFDGSIPDFSDSSSNNLTFYGNFNITTDGSSLVIAPDSFHGGQKEALYCSNAGSAAKFPGDFTVEMWINPDSFVQGYSGGYPGGYCVIFDSSISGNRTTGIAIYISNDGTWHAGDSAGATFVTCSSSYKIQLNSWQHVAVTRLGSTLTIWYNGHNAGSTNCSTDFSDGYITVGADHNSVISMFGNIDDFRITQACIYTDTFSPPTRN